MLQALLLKCSSFAAKHCFVFNGSKTKSIHFVTRNVKRMTSLSLPNKSEVRQLDCCNHLGDTVCADLSSSASREFATNDSLHHIIHSLMYLKVLLLWYSVSFLLQTYSAMSTLRL